MALRTGTTLPRQSITIDAASLNNTGTIASNNLTLNIGAGDLLNGQDAVLNALDGILDINLSGIGTLSNSGTIVSNLSDGQNASSAQGIVQILSLIHI